MNSFGLGIVLDFVDNASPGLHRVNQLFDDLSSRTVGLASGSHLSQAFAIMGLQFERIGDTMVETGSRIMETLGMVANKVLEVGNTVFSSRLQLSTLFGSEEEGSKVMGQIQDYAEKSVFNFEDLIPAVIRFKSVGVDAFQQVATSTGKTKQALLDYVTDLAAFNPTMRNTYGTGAMAAMGAFKEFIAEGNEITMKRSAGIDITGLLGEKKGKTQEDRLRQVVDVMEKMGMTGMTESLRGTPMQRLANLPDLLFRLMTSISDSGVWDRYSELVEKLTDFFFSIPKEEIDNLGKILAETLVAVSKPLDVALEALKGIVNFIRMLAKEHPGIFKIVTVVLGLSGALLFLGGHIFKVIGGLFMLSSIIFQLTLFSRLTIPALGSIGTILSTLAVNVMWFIGIASLLYLAWQKNLFGIKDFFDVVVRDIAETMGLLFSAIFDNDLTVEQFDRAKELGVLPFIESILLLKYHFGILFDGVKEGFNRFFEDFDKAVGKVDFLGFKIKDLSDKVAGFFGVATKPGSEEDWFNVGDGIGYLFGALLVALPALKLFGWVLKGVGLVAKALPAIIGFLSSPIGIVVAVIGSLAYAFATNLWGIRDVTVEVLTAVGNFFIGVGETIWFAMQAVVMVFIGLVDGILNVFSPLYEGVQASIDNLVNVFNSFIDFIANVFTGNWSSAWQNVVSIFSNIFGSILNIARGVLNGVISVVNSVINALNTLSIPSWVPGVGGKGVNIPNVPKLSTGGEIMGEGVSYLHPNEVVVNSPLTNKLRDFLDGTGRNPVDSAKSSDDVVKNVDNSVSFAPGSVVLNIQNGNSLLDRETLNRVADQLMNLMSRKMQLRNMAERNTK